MSDEAETRPLATETIGPVGPLGPMGPVGPLGLGLWGLGVPAGPLGLGTSAAASLSSMSSGAALPSMDALLAALLASSPFSQTQLQSQSQPQQQQQQRQQSATTAASSTTTATTTTSALSAADAAMLANLQALYLGGGVGGVGGGIPPFLLTSSPLAPMTSLALPWAAAAAAATAAATTTTTPTPTTGTTSAAATTAGPLGPSAGPRYSTPLEVLDPAIWRERALDPHTRMVCVRYASLTDPPLLVLDQVPSRFFMGARLYVCVLSEERQTACPALEELKRTVDGRKWLVQNHVSATDPEENPLCNVMFASRACKLLVNWNGRSSPVDLEAFGEEQVEIRGRPPAKLTSSRCTRCAARRPKERALLFIRLFFAHSPEVPADHWIKVDTPPFATNTKKDSIKAMTARRGRRLIAHETSSAADSSGCSGDDNDNDSDNDNDNDGEGNDNGSGHGSGSGSGRGTCRLGRGLRARSDSEAALVPPFSQALPSSPSPPQAMTTTTTTAIGSQTAASESERNHDDDDDDDDGSEDDDDDDDDDIYGKVSDSDDDGGSAGGGGGGGGRARGTSTDETNRAAAVGPLQSLADTSLASASLHELQGLRMLKTVRSRRRGSREASVRKAKASASATSLTDPLSLSLSLSMPPLSMPPMPTPSFFEDKIDEVTGLPRTRIPFAPPRMGAPLSLPTEPTFVSVTKDTIEKRPRPTAVVDDDDDEEKGPVVPTKERPWWMSLETKVGSVARKFAAESASRRRKRNRDAAWSEEQELDAVVPMAPMATPTAVSGLPPTLITLFQQQQQQLQQLQLQQQLQKQASACLWNPAGALARPMAPTSTTPPTTTAAPMGLDPSLWLLPRALPLQSQLAPVASGHGDSTSAPAAATTTTTTMAPLELSIDMSVKEQEDVENLMMQTCLLNGALARNVSDEVRRARFAVTEAMQKLMHACLAQQRDQANETTLPTESTSASSSSSDASDASGTKRPRLSSDASDASGALVVGTCS